MAASELPSLRPETVAVAAGRPGAVGDPLNTPLTLASSFETGDGREYARGGGSPTWEALEEAVGALEGGQAVAFGSGMAAAASVLDQLPNEAHLIIPEDCYHGVGALVADGAKNRGWKVMRLPTSDTEAWVKAIPGADLCWVESPSNPLLEVADVPQICAAANAAGVPVAVDNTFPTPLRQRPLEIGATFSIQSATKFIGGHADLLCGLTITKNSEAVEALGRWRTLRGATPGSLETFLALRGLRTLGVRLDRSEQTATELANRLQEHRQVTRVRYPGLANDPGYQLAKRDLGGPGAVLSFEIRGSATSTDIRLSRLRVITPATSLGGVESLIERRAKSEGQNHLPPTLLRLSVGCEHVEDLWADLDAALSGTGTAP